VLGAGIQWLLERLHRSERVQRDVEARHRAVVEQSSEGILLVDVNSMRFVETNEAFRHLLGYTREEMLGMSLFEVDPFGRDAYNPYVQRLLPGKAGSKGERKFRRKDGSFVDVEANIDLVTVGETRTLSVIVRDITERKQAEEQLRLSEERYALSARAVNDGLWDWDMRSNRVYFSTRWKAMLGYEEHEIGSSMDEWLNRVHPKDADHLKSRLGNYLQTADTHFEMEYRMMHKDGSYRWTLTRGLAVRDDDGKLFRMAGSQTDVTDRKKSEEQLKYDAFHDALTDLPNRTLFLDRLDRSIMRCKQHGDLYAILFLDLDRFKVINDGLGHIVGDQLLIMMAQRLKQCVRPSDTVARFGGDEFTILLDEIKDVSDATAIAYRIQEEMKTPFYVMGHEIKTSASVGIAMGTDEYENSEDLLRDADTAMYRAKAMGKGRHEMFDSAMRTRAVMLLEMESDLWRAMERNEFELFYQPIVRVDTGQITGCEALIYWQHPHRGLVSPGEFIPVAEETGLIEPMGEWVLRTACVQAKKWQEMGHDYFRVAVNCSSRQFQPHLPDIIRKVLTETGLSPQSLTIEVTETLAMKDVEASIAILRQIQKLGVRISIDDFGTGYSSLGYINRLPIHTLKIDRSFVNEITSNSENTVISEMIISMAHSLNLKVVAEGVENEKQLEFLRSQNCDEMQGYFFSRPLSQERLTQMLATESILSSVRYSSY
jgi:diguanylate cyclase (GGDEF)-like protein/PAS domain S-box-containing protein